MAEWYVNQRDKTHGPFSSSQLKQLADAGKIDRETQVRKNADGKWAAARHVKGLFESREVTTFVEAPPPAKHVVEAVPMPARRIPCPICGEEIAETAIKCRFCNEYVDGRPQPPPPPTHQTVAVAPATQPVITMSVVQQVHVPHQRWSPAAAMFLSFLIPGLGQIYKGQPLNGILWFIVTLVGYVMLVVPGLVLHLCCIVGAGMGDPYR
jgi:hypothetical protein